MPPCPQALWLHMNKIESINLCGGNDKQQVVVAVATSGMAFWRK